MNTAVLLEQNSISGHWTATWLDPRVGGPVVAMGRWQWEALANLSQSLEELEEAA